MNGDCIFCKIINGMSPSVKLYEDELCVVISDIRPAAKKHYLLIPKKHYSSLAEMTEDDARDLGAILSTIPRAAAGVLGLKDGYRLIINQGKDAGQEVFHMHVHILGGEQLGQLTS